MASSADTMVFMAILLEFEYRVHLLLGSVALAGALLLPERLRVEGHGLTGNTGEDGESDQG